MPIEPENSNIAAGTKPPRSLRAAAICALFQLTCLVTILAQAWVCYTLAEFFLGTRDLPPGAPMRPMGVTFNIGVPGVAAILFGGLFSLVGVVLAILQGSKRLALLAAFGLIVSWVPMISGYAGFDYIVASRHFVLED
jgi:hypothetical protein